MTTRLRRLPVGLVTGIVALAGYGLVLGGFTQGLAWWWYPVWLGMAALAGWLVSTYVTPEGGLNRGCSQCSQVAIVAVPVSIALLAHGSLTAAVVSFAVLGFGLVQRILSPNACEIPGAR
ncbi:hypothetical protein [Amycolatopsis alkalitolerans]|uniref:Uncharacterized protein n=1 Tax=Amycolatopsis alkalitolerans TaxID=2547244 RepID=A0A5C4M843_9PSEU|nr:hypothetical protein [Amycolatopsis alkalitolerans]TNC29658.1 hypothetical protein FG385_01490 [Amycolatopsis alkalitolerans]